VGPVTPIPVAPVAPVAPVLPYPLAVSRDIIPVTEFIYKILSDATTGKLLSAATADVNRPAFTIVPEKSIGTFPKLYDI
jgi:hypothetical protein